MKKLIATAAAAGLLSAGLIGGAGTASADPYPGEVETVVKPKVPNVVTPGNAVKVRVNIDAIGNAEAKGKVRFVIRKLNGKKVKVVTRNYDGAKTFGLGKLAKGKYKVAINFKTGKNSVFKNSRTVENFKVGR